MEEKNLPVDLEPIEDVLVTTTKNKEEAIAEEPTSPKRSLEIELLDKMDM